MAEETKSFPMIRQFLTRWFDLPARTEFSPKSELRLQFEAEARNLHFHGAAALDGLALVLIDGARLCLSGLDALLRRSRTPFICNPKGSFVDAKIRREEAKWQENEDYRKENA